MLGPQPLISKTVNAANSKLQLLWLSKTSIVTTKLKRGKTVQTEGLQTELAEEIKTLEESKATKPV